MSSRSTRILRLAPCASVLAVLALTVGSLAQIPPATTAELSRRVEVVDGKTIIVIRARPPARLPAPPPAPAVAAPPSAAERLEERRLAARKHASFTVVATVFAGPPVLTELRWNAAGREWLAFSNVDFRALTQLSSMEIGDTIWQWFPFVTDGDAESRPRPPGLSFSGLEAEYVVYASRAEWEAAPEAFTALDWLISYYEDNRIALDTALAMRRAEAARRAAEPPPPPKPVVIRHYVSEVPAASRAVSEGGSK